MEFFSIRCVKIWKSRGKKFVRECVYWIVGSRAINRRASKCTHTLTNVHAYILKYIYMKWFGMPVAVSGATDDDFCIILFSTKLLMLNDCCLCVSYIHLYPGAVVIQMWLVVAARIVSAFLFFLLSGLFIFIFVFGSGRGRCREQ